MADSGTNDNLKPLKRQIKQAFDRRTKLKGDRKGINDEMSADLEKLQAKGIGKEPFRMASKYMGLDEDQRRAFDIAYAVCREALGSPLQSDLFDNPQPFIPASGDGAED